MTDVVELVELEGGIELRLHGNVDISSATTLYTAACAACDVGDVLVVWDTVEQIDTSAFQILLALRREVARAGYAWRTGAPSAAVVEALRLLGLATAFKA